MTKPDLKHPHDLLVRKFLGESDLAADFLKNYLPREWAPALDFDSLKREPTESINRNLSELMGDLRYSARFRETGRELRVFLFLEHQSRPDRFMSFRLLEYVCAAYRQQLSAFPKRQTATFPYPMAVVLHHGKTPWKKVLPMRELIDTAPGVPPDILQLPVCLVDLARIPGDKLRGHPAVCAVLDSLQSASNGRFHDRATGIFKRLRSVRNENRFEAWTYSLAKYYSSVQGQVRSGVNDLKRILSELYNAKEVRKMAGTIAEELQREGLIKGKAEGKVEAIITFLESRFGKIPAKLKNKLLAMQDSERIDSVLKHAATCQDLKEFQRAL